MHSQALASHIGGFNDFIIEGKVTEDYSQRARNFRVALRRRLEAMKKGKKIKYGKLAWTALGNGNFKDSKGRTVPYQDIVQDLKFAVQPDIMKHRGAAGDDMVNAYLKFEDKLTEGLNPVKAARVIFDKLAFAKLIGKQNRKRAEGIIEFQLRAMNFGEGKLSEANRGKVFTAAKKGSFPATIVVVQNGKVIHQEKVSTPEAAPAKFNVMQEKYPKALIHLEDTTGKRLFSEATSLWKHFDAKMKLQDEIMDLEYEMKTITNDIKQLHIDMEQEAEPEGGPKATKYGKEIEKKEKEYKQKKVQFKKLMAKLDRMEQY